MKILHKKPEHPRNSGSADAVSKPVKLFLKYAKRHYGAFYVLTFVYITSTALLVLAPQTLSRFIDAVYGNGRWTALVSAILLYLAALHQIPDELKQAAHIDGASGWEFYWKVSLPLTSPYLSVIAVYTAVDAFFRRGGGHISRISGTNPYGFLRRMERLIFEDGLLGEASALAWLYFALCFIMIMLLIWLLSKVTFYDN